MYVKTLLAIDLFSNLLRLALLVPRFPIPRRFAEVVVAQSHELDIPTREQQIHALRIFVQWSAVRIDNPV